MAKERDGLNGAVPAELLLFDGRGFATYNEWTAAFDAWCDAREAWEKQHDQFLPEGVELGKCPDPFASSGPGGLPHGGRWSRPDYSDGPVRCAEHELIPDEH